MITLAVVVPAADVQPLTRTVTLYNPLAVAVALLIDGFCCDDANPLGPVQLYVTPDTVEAVRFNVEPAQNGPLFPAVGADGMAFTVRVIVAAVAVDGDAQPMLEVNWQSILSPVTKLPSV